MESEILSESDSAMDGAKCVLDDLLEKLEPPPIIPLIPRKSHSNSHLGDNDAKKEEQCNGYPEPEALAPNIPPTDILSLLDEKLHHNNDTTDKSDRKSICFSEESQPGHKAKRSRENGISEASEADEGSLLSPQIQSRPSLSATISQLAARVSFIDTQENEDDDEDDDDGDAVDADRTFDKVIQKESAEDSVEKNRNIDSNFENDKDDKNSEHEADKSALDDIQKGADMAESVDDYVETNISADSEMKLEESSKVSERDIDADTPPRTMTKDQLNDALKKRFYDFVSTLFEKAESMETRFSHLEKMTEALRRRHREQDKTLMKIERTTKSNDRRGGCRHVACQTNLGGGSLIAAQKMSRGPSRQPAPAGSAGRHPGNSAKRNQEVVDLTDEDSGPALKRPATAHTQAFSQSGQVPVSSNAALQRLVDSGAAKFVGGAPTKPSSPANVPLRSVTNQQVGLAYLQQSPAQPPPGMPLLLAKHPAPLPSQPVLMVLGAKPTPPKPWLKIELVPMQHNRGVMLSWDINSDLSVFSKIVKYQLFAYQETVATPSPSLWKKVGDDVAAMPLPMACTLSHFLSGNRYHFAVRAMDEHSRVGPFSDPQSIFLD